MLESSLPVIDLGFPCNWLLDYFQGQLWTEHGAIIKG